MIRLLAEEDRQIILEYLSRNEIETSFLYANVSEFGIENRKDAGRYGDYFGFFNNGSLAGILPFYNIGSCIPHFETEDAVPSFVHLMKERSFRRLIGMDRIIRPVYREINSIKEIAEFNEDSYLVNKNFRPYNISGLEFIDPGQMADDKRIIDFIMQVRSNGFHETADPGDIKQSLSSANLEEDKVIAVKDGKMVAYALIQTYTNTLNQIGSVYTVEEERGKGYCKAVVSELCRRILVRNKMPALFVRKSNIPAVKAYSALGFEYYDDYLLIKFK